MILSAPDAIADWHFRNDCPSNSQSGHSTLGTLRWGNPSDCNDYGDTGNIGIDGDSGDSATTPLISTSGCGSDDNLELNFNYFLQFQEDSDFDDARVFVMVMGVMGMSDPVADNGDSVGNLISNASWNNITINLSELLGTIPDNLEIQFLGEIDDGFANSAEGFVIDDITVSCRQVEPAPTLSQWGFISFALFSGLIALWFIRRKQVLGTRD